MRHPKSPFLILISILYLSCSAQKLPQYRTIDSLKTEARARPDRDLIDSLKEQAHDMADSIMDHMDNSSHFEIGAAFASNQLYTGRRGPASGMVGSPQILYQHKTGFYISLGLDIYQLQYRRLSLVPVGTRVDTSIKNASKIEPDVIPTIGFQRTFFDKWDLDVSLDHTFIFYGGDRNYLATSFNLRNSFDFWSYITATVDYTLLFGGSGRTARSEMKYSNILTFEVLHDFKVYCRPGVGIFTISPICDVYAGNDNLTRNRIKARDINGGLSDQTSAALADKFFGLLDVEAAIRLDFRIKNLNIYLCPRVAVPINVVPATASSAAPYRNNKASSPMWYAEAGFRYLFRFWKEKGRHH